MLVRSRLVVVKSSARAEVEFPKSDCGADPVKLFTGLLLFSSIVDSYCFDVEEFEQSVPTQFSSYSAFLDSSKRNAWVGGYGIIYGYDAALDFARKFFSSLQILSPDGSS